VAVDKRPSGWLGFFVIESDDTANFVNVSQFKSCIKFNCSSFANKQASIESSGRD